MIHFPPEVAGLFKPLSLCRPHPDNPNNGDIDAIVESLHVNGCYRPIYYSTATGHIVGGHHLYHALLSEGMTHGPLLGYDGLTPEAELRILAADNQIARLARMDPALELQMMKRLLDTETGLRGSGYDEQNYHDALGGTATGRAGEDINLDEPTHCPHCGAEIDLDLLI